MAGCGAVRSVAVAVPSDAQGPRAQLVGDARSARAARAGDEWRLWPRAASDVFGILALGAGAGAAAAKLDRGRRRSGRIRDAVLSACRAGGGADGRDLRRRIPALHGAHIPDRAGDLLARPDRHQRGRCIRPTNRVSRLCGNSTLIATLMRSINRGMTMRFPALKPRHPTSAMSGEFDRGINFMRWLCPTEQRSKNAVLTTPGVRQV